MPWSIVSNHAECPSSESWAVVKDEDGSVVGCHETEGDAQDQLTALNIAEEESNSMSATDEQKRPSPKGTQPDIERRAFALRDVEIRAEANEDGSIGMTGYAAVFNSRSVVMWDWWEGSFVEEVEPGAFSKTIKDGDVRLLINHDPNLLLARSRSGTLKLAEDDVGLKVDADMAPTSYAQDLSVSMRRGDMSQMSFAFRTIRDSWAETEDGMPLRRLEEVALLDTSIVTYPAYPESQAKVRSLEFQALANVLGLGELSRDERDAFINDLINNQIRPERLPTLQAARQALEARIAAVEPHDKHSIDMGIYRRKHHDALALIYGLEGTALNAD